MEFKLKPEFNKDKNCWNIAVQGEIDIYNSSNVKDYLSNLIQEHPTDVFMDCTNLEYIDSTGLGALVAVVKKIKQYNGDFHLSNVKSNVSKVFKITNLDKVFIIN